MRLPNFLYIGPPKAGSTWLYEALRFHPEVYMSPAKELHYFDQYYHRRKNWYLRHFRGATPAHKVVGEISHDYLYSKDACLRIFDLLGVPSLLTCVREPVERAFSDYLYMVRQGYVRCEFERAIERNPEIIEHSLYAKYLSTYQNTFGRDAIKIAVFDDLVEDASAFFKGICSALGIQELDPQSLGSASKLGAAAPRSYVFARSAKAIATAMRKAGFATIITRVKSMNWVQRALYQEYDVDTKPKITPEAWAKVRAKVFDDVMKLDEEFVPGIASRWGYKSN